MPIILFYTHISYLSYNNPDKALTYRRTSSGNKVDEIIGDGLVTIEIKSNNEVSSRHLKGLKAFKEDFPTARAIVVSMDKYKQI